MSKRKDGQARGKYTLEFKLEAGASGQGRTVGARERQNPGCTFADARELGSPERARSTQGCWRQAGFAGTAGIGSAASRAGAREEGARHFKEGATAYFARESL
jgi:hypothetical protein